MLLHADTTPANVHEAKRTEPIHAALVAKGLAPAEHLVDAAYISAEHLVAARERYDIDLIGPARPVQNWQAKEKDAFIISDFVVDWERRRVRCPEGRDSTGWGESRSRTSGRPSASPVRRGPDAHEVGAAA